jgi:uncharacterized membrane protein required for colicin V production
MTVLDWVLVVIWTGITLGGFFKGAVRIVFSLGGLVLGLWLAAVVGPNLAAELSDSVDHQWLASALAYIIPFAVATLLCLLAGWGMEKTLEGLKLGCVNRMFGAVLAGAAAAVVLAFLLATAARLSPELARFEERSALLGRIQALVGVAAGQSGDRDAGADSQDAAQPGDSPEDASDRNGSNGR